jgi:hypothetical protein
MYHLVVARNFAHGITSLSGARQESSLQLKKTLLAASAAVIVGAAGLIVIATPASARVVCNSYGDCWHTDARYDYNRYDRDQRPVYHSDDWYFHQHWDSDRDHHFRESHEGRGYYKNGIWLSF